MAWAAPNVDRSFAAKAIYLYAGVFLSALKHAHNKSHCQGIIAFPLCVPSYSGESRAARSGEEEEQYEYRSAYVCASSHTININNLRACNETLIGGDA